MSKPTFQSLYKELQAMIGDESSNTLVQLKTFINETQREIWEESVWHFRRKKGRFNTLAPYSTGILTLTKGSTTVSISGGSLTGLEGYKVALAAQQPYYRILSVAVGGLSATLEIAYAGATVTTASGAFLIYQDTYELPDTHKKIISMKLIRAGWPQLEYVPQQLIDDYMTAQGLGSSIPRFYNDDALASSLSTSQEAIHVFLMPIPNDLYPVEYMYAKGVVDMVADSDLPSLPEEFMKCLKNGSKALAYQLDYQMAEQGTAAQQLYTAELQSLVNTFTPEATPTFRLRACDDTRRYRASMSDNLRRSFNQ